jgi:hypothetical protein
MEEKSNRLVYCEQEKSMNFIVFGRGRKFKPKPKFIMSEIFKINGWAEK